LSLFSFAKIEVLPFPLSIQKREMVRIPLFLLYIDWKENGTNWPSLSPFLSLSKASWIGRLKDISLSSSPFQPFNKD